MVTEKDGKQKIADPDTFDSDIASDIVTYLLSAADYNEYADMNLKLKDDEILIYSSGKEWEKGDNLNFMGKEYTVAGEAEYSAIRYIIDSTMSIFEREILVFPDDEQICALMAEAGQIPLTPPPFPVDCKGQPKGSWQTTLRGRAKSIFPKRLCP